MASTFRLRCHDGGWPGGLVLSAANPTAIIGRSRTADFRVNHPQVSANQCTISLSNNKLYLQDTSTNGTYVNGREVRRNETIQLYNSMVVTLLVPSVDERDAEFGNAVPAFVVEVPPKPAYQAGGAANPSFRRGLAGLQADDHRPGSSSSGNRTSVGAASAASASSASRSPNVFPPGAADDRGSSAMVEEYAAALASVLAAEEESAAAAESAAESAAAGDPGVGMK